MTVGSGIDELAKLYSDRVQVRPCQRQGVDPEHVCLEDAIAAATPIDPLTLPTPGWTAGDVLRRKVAQGRDPFR